ncbi:hypothetical protein HDU83_006704 [Entophlyctis luteolus]|nr:hypothetical protein HDU83_006704 [Entophlyctis luteolus]
MPAVATATAATTSTTTLRISVKQRNGSIATITTEPVKVTRGFDAPSSSNGDSTAVDGAADLLPYMPGNPPMLLGVSGSRANTRRIYSNVSTSSTASLQTFFGVGEGQALKERLIREQELRDQQQQAIWIEQQQALARQQQQRLLQRARNARKQKASFAIGNSNGEGFHAGDGGDEDEYYDDNADSALGDDGDDRDDAQTATGIRSVSSLASLKSPESGLRIFGSVISAGSNSPHLLTRRTFPSAPYLPLYSLPNRPDSPAAPAGTAAKLLLNPNPNSSSAADIPNLARNISGNASAPVNEGKKSAASSGADAAAPVAITRVSGGSGGIDSNTKPAPPPQPAELQAPLHGTPTIAAAPPSDADLQAAAAAARARGHNLPRNVPDFYRRLQDLRAANIRQLEALRVQIEGLRAVRNGADVAYYEKEMRTLVESLRRDEAALVDFGRRGLGIDVNTLSLMLSNLPLYDPAQTGNSLQTSSAAVSATVAGTHAHEYPNTMDLMRRTKSSAHLVTANGGGGLLRASQSHQRIPAVSATASSNVYVDPRKRHSTTGASTGRMRTQTTATARISALVLPTVVPSVPGGGAVVGGGTFNSGATTSHSDAENEIGGAVSDAGGSSGTGLGVGL